MTRGALARALDLLLPPGCVSCRSWLPDTSRRRLAPICPRCRSRLRIASWPRCLRCHAPLGTGPAPAPTIAGQACHECSTWPESLSTARSAVLLEGPASDLVHALKYEGWIELAEFMADRMARSLPEVACDLVAAVPTTPERARRRGYNQAEVLARPLATRLARPFRHLLRRPVGGRSQVALEPRQRRVNVSGVFAPARGIEVARDQTILLVDDVLTTGATASEAASVLMDHGAHGVHLVTFARALPGAVSALS